MIFKGEMEIKGKRKSSVRVGALSMAIDRRQKENLLIRRRPQAYTALCP